MSTKAHKIRQQVTTILTSSSAPMTVPEIMRDARRRGYFPGVRDKIVERNIQNALDILVGKGVVNNGKTKSVLKSSGGYGELPCYHLSNLSFTLDEPVEPQKTTPAPPAPVKKPAAAATKIGSLDVLRILEGEGCDLSLIEIARIFCGVNKPVDRKISQRIAAALCFLQKKGSVVVAREIPNPDRDPKRGSRPYVSTYEISRGKGKATTTEEVVVAEPTKTETKTTASLPVPADPPGGVFHFDGNAIHVIERDGEPWFVASEVCGVLDLGHVTNTLARLDKDECNTITLTDTIGRKQEVRIINESGLYSLILTSRKPEAKKFKKWVTSEVLPSIRKTGSYVAPKVNTVPTSHLELFKMAIASIEEQGATVAAIQADVNHIKETRKLEHWQALKLQDFVHTKVARWVDSKPGASLPTLYRRLWHSINTHFGVPRYSEIPSARFNEAVEVINSIRLIDLVAPQK